MEPLLRKFINNLKNAVKKKKAAKNEIVSYFLINESQRNISSGKKSKQLNRASPIGAKNKVNLDSEINMMRTLDAKLNPELNKKSDGNNAKKLRQNFKQGNYKKTQLIDSEVIENHSLVYDTPYINHLQEKTNKKDNFKK